VRLYSTVSAAGVSVRGVPKLGEGVIGLVAASSVACTGTGGIISGRCGCGATRLVCGIGAGIDEGLVGEGLDSALFMLEVNS
jgi:hypothetical protein